jgi:hypothetical protein
MLGRKETDMAEDFEFLCEIAAYLAQKGFLTKRERLRFLELLYGGYACCGR